MTTTTLITLSPDELEKLIRRAIAPYAEAVRSLETKISPRKHAYTVNEVAEQIGYSRRVVIQFMKEGRPDRNNKKHRLLYLEVTTGEYRILPIDLDNWLSHFK